MSIQTTSITQELVKTGIQRRVRVDGRDKTLQVLLPKHQSAGAKHFPQRRTLNTEFPLNAFSNNGQKFTVQIRRNDIDKVGHIKLAPTFQVSGAPVVMPPMTHIFDRIEVRTAGDNALVCTTYPDVMLANILSRTSKGRQRAVLADLNIDYSEAGYLGTGPVKPVGSFQTFIPLYFSGFFENFDLYLADSKADLNFDFYPAQSGIVVSGAGSVAMTNLQFIIENDKLTEADRTAYKTMYSQYSRENYFLDPVLTQKSTQALTAGAINYIDMSNVQGLVSHHYIFFKATGSSNVGNTRMRYLNIGDNEAAAIDLTDPGQQSQFGAGSAVPTKYLRGTSIDSMDCEWINAAPCYVLSYAENFGKSLHGMIDGCHVFDGSRQQLAFTLPAAGVSEVQTIAKSGTISAGSYRFMFKGVLSEELAFDATPSQMAAAFASIKSASSRFVTATFSAALSAGGATSLTATFIHPQTSGLEGEVLQVVGNGLGARCTTTVTTAGTAGLASGSYDVSIYSMVYRRGSYINGTLRSDLLIA